MILITTIAALAFIADPPQVTIDRDNIGITESCRVQVVSAPILDVDGNGVMHITADNITVEFLADSQPLHGAKPNQLPDSFAGTGIVITGKHVTVFGAKVSGYKVGIHAKDADGLTIHHSDVSGNFAQRLKSTPHGEDAGDWLWPHANDNNEWITNYGAGLCVEDSTNVKLHDIRARRTQNGIILDAVNDSKVYDCDCSFLSGWGLAMWRSSRNVISRNAFDFCVRGYSHGVYNRGQDSAGILMFEQCCENVIAENSCTHGGDGFFGFAGKEALGEVHPREDLQWYKRRGNNDNQLTANDFSHAVAHGVEMTFSFRNSICRNRLVDNAICGVWGGYSQDSKFILNTLEDNGGMAYGLERGGINIEHGYGNEIAANVFRRNKVGIRLWNDDDFGMADLPWIRQNERRRPKGDSSEPVGRPSSIRLNSFESDGVGVEIQSAQAHDDAGNRYSGVVVLFQGDDASRSHFDAQPNVERTGFTLIPECREFQAEGATTPVGARKALAGRENAIMTEWGPWDHASPLLQFVQRFDHADEYRLRGSKGMPAAERIAIEGDVLVEVCADVIRITPRATNTLAPYRIAFAADGHPLDARGTLTGGTWTVKTFASPIDPRIDVDRWRTEGLASPSVHTRTADDLDFVFGSGGMSEARHLPVKLPRDHFGVIATRALTFPAGGYRLNATSDDGIRVWLDDELVIDDWTHHAPRRHVHDFEIAEARELAMRVEYFELDGHAVLEVAIGARE